VTKIYYLELLRVSEGTLSRWSRLHFQSLATSPILRRVDVRQAAGCKNSCQIFYHNMIKHILYRPHFFPRELEVGTRFTVYLRRGNKRYSSKTTSQIQVVKRLYFTHLFYQNALIMSNFADVLGGLSPSKLILS
jgi:hypothetical protein